VTAGQSLITYVWKDDTPSAVIYAANSPANANNEQERIVYLHTDHMNTPRKATDAQARLVWSWTSDAFGSNAANEDTDSNGSATMINVRFPGQYFDAESGLHYNWNRYYDPRAGRYTQSDPIGLAGGINTYSYVEGNPLSFSDPEGLKTMQCTKPLNALGSKYGPLGYKYGPMLYHQYSCIVGKDGKVTCGGQDRGENGAGKPSKDIIDPPGGQCKETEPDNQCYEQCLVREWAKPRPKYGIPFGTDCQEYDDEVNTICRKQCKAK
jgi:RHS repeat-associated protein